MARYLKLGKESTYGTPVAGAYTIRFTSENLKLEHGYIRSRTVEARELTRSAAGPKKVSGGWEQCVNYKNIGLILKALLGDETKSNPAAGVALHTFTRNALGSLPSLTARVGKHDVAETVYHGLGVDSLSLTLEPEDYLKAKIDVIGEDLTTGTVDGAPSFADMDFASLTDTFTLGGVAATPERFALTIKNGLKSDHHNITSRLLPRIEAGELEVTGEMDIRFLDTTHLDDFLAGTRRALVGKWRGGVISGAYNYELEVDVNDIEYDAADAFVDRQERLVESLAFTAVKASGSGILTVKLQNDEDVVY